MNSHNHGHPFDFLGHPLAQDARLLTSGLKYKTNTKDKLFRDCCCLLLVFHIKLSLGSSSEEETMILSTENGSASIRYRIRRVGSNILRRSKMLFSSAFCLDIILTKGANCQHLRTSKYVVHASPYVLVKSSLRPIKRFNRYPLKKCLKSVLLEEYTKSSIQIKHSL